MELFTCPNTRQRTYVYISIVLKPECPRNWWIIRMSIPSSNERVANARRNE
jgi:hypothetical protein